jgi:hypothetical protein
MKLVRVNQEKKIKSSMLARFVGLLHGFELLEGNIHDQDDPP